MVNMDYIESFDQKQFRLKNRKSLAIAAARRKEIIQVYADYIFDHCSKGDLMP